MPSVSDDDVHFTSKSDRYGDILKHKVYLFDLAFPWVYYKNGNKNGKWKTWKSFVWSRRRGYGV